MGGCYRIEIGDWQPVLDLRNDTIFLRPPAVVELLDEPAPGPLLAGGRMMRPAPGMKPGIHRYQAWYRRDAGRLRLIWTTGFSGLEAELEPIGKGRFRGTARSRWDFERERQTAGMTATPVRCGSGSALE